jgi:hypothetical protein
VPWLADQTGVDAVVRTVLTPLVAVPDTSMLARDVQVSVVAFTVALDLKGEVDTAGAGFFEPGALITGVVCAEVAVDRTDTAGRAIRPTRLTLPLLKVLIPVTSD